MQIDQGKGFRGTLLMDFESKISPGDLQNSNRGLIVHSGFKYRVTKNN